MINSPKKSRSSFMMTSNCFTTGFLTTNSHEMIKTEMMIFQKPGFEINLKWNVILNGYKLTLSDQSTSELT
jgi:hypothetical protein